MKAINAACFRKTIRIKIPSGASLTALHTSSKNASNEEKYATRGGRSEVTSEGSEVSSLSGAGYIFTGLTDAESASVAKD